MLKQHNIRPSFKVFEIFFLSMVGYSIVDDRIDPSRVRFFFHLYFYDDYDNSLQLLLT